jgi:uncharacterized repeat protein (TIGR01451 family)
MRACHLKAFIIFAWLFAVSCAAIADDIKQIDLPSNDIVYDASRGQIYASVPSTAVSNANSIAIIDPVAGTVTSFIPVGSGPNRLALSDDNQFLYVGLDGMGAVLRINLPSLTTDTTFSLGTNQFGTLIADQIAVLPGSPHSVAVARRCAANVSPPSNDVAIYDDGVMRTKTVSSLPPGRIQFSNDAGRLYGIDPYGEPTIFYRMNVDTSGVVVADSEYNILNSAGCLDIRFDRGDGLIYTTLGDVLDPVTVTVVGNFSGLNFDTTVLPDSTIDRTFFVTDNFGVTAELRAYRQSDLTFIRSLQVPADLTGCCSCYKIIRWGTDGLVYRTSGHVYVIHGCIVLSADLAITMTAQPNPPVLDSNVTYSITVTNKGPDDAVGATLTDTLPPGLTFVSSSLDCVPTGNVVNCSLGTLTTGSSTNVTLVALATSPGILVNTAIVASVRCDSVQSNNMAVVPQSNVDVYGVLKAQLFVQTNTGAPKKVRPTGFVFVAEVDPIATGSVASASVRLPSGEIGTLSTGSTDIEYDFSDQFSAVGQLNRAYPDSEYTLTIGDTNGVVKILNLNLPSGLFPKPPHVNNWVATQVMNTNQNLTIVWDALPGGTKADVVGVSIQDEVNNQDVFFTPNPGQPGALDGTATSVTVPSNTFSSSGTYLATLTYIKNPVLDSTSFPGAQGIAGHTTITGFEIRPTSGPTPGAGVLEYSSPVYVASAAAGSALITVVRVGGSSGAITVDFATAKGSAVAAVDYVPVSGTLSFGDGETVRTISITTINHSSRKPRSTVGLALRNPTGGAKLGKSDKATLDILHDN